MLKRLRSLLSRSPRVVIESGPAGARWATVGRYAAYAAAVVAVLGGALSLRSELSGSPEETIPIGPPEDFVPARPSPGAPDLPACVALYLLGSENEEGETVPLAPARCWGPDPLLPKGASPFTGASLRKIGEGSPRSTGTRGAPVEVYRLCYALGTGEGTLYWVFDANSPAEGEPYLSHPRTVEDPRTACPPAAGSPVEEETSAEKLDAVADFLRWCHGPSGDSRVLTADYSSEICPEAGSGEGSLTLGSWSAGSAPGELEENAEISLPVAYLTDNTRQHARIIRLRATGGRWLVAGFGEHP